MNDRDSVEKSKPSAGLITMHHVIFTSDFKPKVGGIAQYLQGIASGLAEHDDVTVVAWGIEPTKSFDPEYEVQYVEARKRRFGQRWRGSLPLFRKLDYACHVLRQRGETRRVLEDFLVSVRDEPLRVYIGVWNAISHWWCAQLRHLNVPYRLFAYGKELLYPRDFIHMRWRKVDFSSAETVFACSAATASLIDECINGANTVTVRPGVTRPESALSIENRAEELRDSLGIRSDDQVLVTVGRLVKRKGIHTVMEVLASQEWAERPIRYVVAGSGPEKDRLSRMSRELGIEERMHFLGHVNELTKWAVYAIGDVFVMPNSDLDGQDWEGFGIVFLEAAVMGLPAIAGDSGGAVEAIEDGKSGLLIDPKSREELCDALRRFLNDRNRSRVMGRQARERAAREFTWEKAVKRIRDQ